MKNKRLMTLLIPVLAIAALVGTGFGGWVFATDAATTVSKSLNPDVALTPAVNTTAGYDAKLGLSVDKDGKFSAKDSLDSSAIVHTYYDKIVFDGERNTDIGTVKDDNNDGDYCSTSIFVHLSKTNKKVPGIIAEWNGSSNEYTEDSSYNYNAQTDSSTFRFTIAVTLSTDHYLSNYLTLEENCITVANSDGSLTNEKPNVSVTNDTAKKQYSCSTTVSFSSSDYYFYVNFTLKDYTLSKTTYTYDENSSVTGSNVSTYQMVGSDQYNLPLGTSSDKASDSSNPSYYGLQDCLSQFGTNPISTITISKV